METLSLQTLYELSAIMESFSDKGGQTEAENYLEMHISFQSLSDLWLHNLDMEYFQLELKRDDIRGNLSIKEYAIFVY